MSTKNRIIRNFVALVPDYTRSKCERYESGIQRCLNVTCCMENLSLFDTSQPDIIEFFINLKELLKACDNNSALGWKAIELVKHLISDPAICAFICELEFVPILSQYLHSQLESDKAILVLSVLEVLTEGIILNRTGYWVGNLLKYLTNAILEKSDYTRPHLLAVLSNVCFENYVAINMLQKERRSEEMLQYLTQLHSDNGVVQLHASQVVFSLLAIGSISEKLLYDYFRNVVDTLTMGAKTNNTNLIKRCGSILLWMSRDRLIVEMMQASHFQEPLQHCLEGLVSMFPASQNTATINSILSFMTKLFRSPLLSNKKFTEAFIPVLIPLLEINVDENLLELLADLLKSTPTLGLMEESCEQLFNKAVNLINEFNSPTCKKSCRILRYALQILQNLYKISPSNTRNMSSLRPETFVNIISNFVVLSGEGDERKADLSLVLNPVAINHYTSEATAIVVEALTFLGQIACRGGEWLQKYSFLLGDANIQQCLASALLHGETTLKQATLSLVGTLGFSSDSVTGLSLALNQLCTFGNGTRRGSAADDASRGQSGNRSDLNWTLPPAQSQKIDQLTQQMQNQEKFWEDMKTCQVIELMELQLGRREREERRLRLDLDLTQQELNAVKISRMQIEAENGKMLAMVLSKNELVELKESENRGLSRRLEHSHQQQRSAEANWKKERERMQKEKERFERDQTETTSKIQAQLDGASKQIKNLIKKGEEMDEELKETKKSCEAFKSSVARKEKELEKQSQELQELKINYDNLRKALRKKEKEVEEKDRDIASSNQMLKKSEMVRQDLETRLIDAEKTCTETKEKLTKLEKIHEFILELSSGKKKLFEDK